MKKTTLTLLILASLTVLLLFTNCQKASDGNEDGLSGTVQIDGSSTVFPITEAVAEEFQKIHHRVRVTVGISGTGGGFKKFYIGETDINDASRVIKSKELDKSAEHNIDFIELPVAYDGLSVLVNPGNDFVDYLTVEELKKIWQPGSTVEKWSDVRPEWPDQPITLYGPGMDLGTFYYFTNVINGEEQACRPDFTASEDDNVLVQGIAGDKNALGFFGFAYYAENRSRLKLVPIDGGDGPVAPSMTTINDGTYKPLSRPIFIYVSTESAKRTEVEAFVKFYIHNAPTLVEEVGYVALPQQVYQLDLQRFEARISGSAFAGRNTEGKSMADLLREGM
ncbi:MAG TPA: PstS family phosphate ABC transporter substrate-binding protein [Bacteroidetes bacterium]|nr:PstS family phosphate ABC transporter substrate-binding protein [Bacteroidota bacterium]HEX03804.1 PstS family phosphate ABC transporter substrate-binding protein [Bacteroidota bacterium]